MSYFSADERIERGEGLPPAPYSLRLSEMDERSAEIGLVWQRPLGRVEGYLVLVRTAQKTVQSSRFKVQSYQAPNSTLNFEPGTLNSEEWRVTLRVVGREKSGARWRVPDEIWVQAGVELAVCAFVGEVASPLSNVVVLSPRLRAVTRLGSWPVVEEAVQEQSRAQPSPTEDIDVRQGQSRGQPSPTEEPCEMMSEGETESSEQSPQLAGWAEIEAALRRNSAVLGRHGLFIRRNN